jgi:hypothetical protein
MAQLLVAVGMITMGLLCVVFLFVPARAADPAGGRPWASYGLIVLAAIFFVLAGLFAFGWVKA